MPDETPKLQTVAVSKNMLAVGAMIFGLVIPTITFFGATSRTSAVFGEKISQGAEERDKLEERLVKLEEEVGGVDVMAEQIRAVRTSVDENNKLLRELLTR